MDDAVARGGASSASADMRTPLGSEYGADYYETYGRLGSGSYSRENPFWLQFFGAVADEIVQKLNPGNVLDVGCAKGFLVECLRDRGVEAYGFDISEYAIGKVRDDIKQYCWVDTAREGIEGNYDLVICIEVCEHLPEEDANEAVRQMTSHSDTVLFSSTPSDFTEATHVNVRPIIDWLRLFSQFSFAPDEGFDAGFLAPQAVLFRRARARPSDQALCRFASLKNRAVTIAELKLREAVALRRELDGIYNSRGWKILNFCGRLRDRVKYLITQMVDALRSLGDDK
jgi:hypothetical protein